MKITIYELLGMIKDGKAPKKIKYREMTYYICYECGDYESDIEEYRFADTKEHYYLFEDIDMLKCLNNEVEILEEEKKIPEKLFFTHISNYNDQSVVNNNFNNYFKKTQETINQLIDYLKSKGDK